MRRMSFLLVALIAAVLLASCGGSDDSDNSTGTSDEEPPDPFHLRPAEGPSDAERVVVVGDSITLLSSDALSDALADKRSSITAVQGFRFGQFDLEGIDDQDPDVVVIALGTNNVTQGGWHDDDEEEMNDLLDQVGDRDCTLLVDIAGVGDESADHRMEGDFDKEADAANRALSEAADERSDDGNPTRIIAWSEVAPRPGVIDDDGIHPTDEGSEEWAQLIADEIDAGC